jgi:hypothetical protein
MSIGPAKESKDAGERMAVTTGPEGFGKESAMTRRWNARQLKRAG